jgi:hypothetical protein
MKERAAGHVARTEDMTNAYNILVIKPGEKGTPEKPGFSGSVSTVSQRRKSWRM